MIRIFIIQHFLNQKATWRQSYYNLKVSGSQLTTDQQLSQLDINSIVSMVRQANISIEEPRLNDN